MLGSPQNAEVASGEAACGGGEGVAPCVWRDGGRGATIAWAVAETALGAMLIAGTVRGVCTLDFGADETLLLARFPNAELVRGGDVFASWIVKAVAAVAAPEQPHDLPLDLGGTAFQQAVWRALARVPPGEVATYNELAVRAGKPGAARAAGSACGANRVAVLVPCHRARRGDGSAGGYAWGLDLKAELLRREGTVLL